MARGTDLNQLRGMPGAGGGILFAGSVPVSAPAIASTLSGLGWMRPIWRMLLAFL
jgi:hypothetical protein